jgi:hypothetical protein
MPFSQAPTPLSASPTKTERNCNVDLTLRPPIAWLPNSVVTIVEPKKNYIDSTLRPVVQWVQNTVVPKHHVEPLDDERYVNTLIVDEIEQFDQEVLDRDFAKLREDTVLNNAVQQQPPDREEAFSAPRWWGEVSTQEVAGQTRENRFELDLPTATSLTMVDSDLRLFGRRGTVDGSSRDIEHDPVQYDSRRSSACVLMGQEKRASIAQPLSEQLRQRALKSVSTSTQGGVKVCSVFAKRVEKLLVLNSLLGSSILFRYSKLVEG